MSVRTSHSGPATELTTGNSSTGTYSGDDVDWDTSPIGSNPSTRDQWKQPVRVASTASVTISTALNAGDTIDGVTLAAGDRVLVKDQATGSQNGIYVAGTTPARADDMDEDGEVMGSLVYVIAGTASSGKVYRNTNTSVPTIDSTSLTFSEITANVATSFGTPANTYGTPAAGAASTAIRTDAVLPGPPIVILTLTNKSGGSVAAGDVVVIDTANDTAFTTTTTGQAEVSVGIAQATIANNASGAVLVQGYAALVNVPSSMTRGRYLETHTVAKQATGSATRRAGSFGQFLIAGSTPTAWLWGQTDQTASGGSSLTVQEVDGSPTDSAVTTIVFPNGTLGIAAHVATYTPSGGGGPTDYYSGASGTGHITIPGLAVPDRLPTSPSAFDDEFGALSGWTSLGTLDTSNVSDVASHWHAVKAMPNSIVTHGIYKTAPSMPFTVTAHVSAADLDADFQGYGILLTESGPGKCTVFHLIHNGLNSTTPAMYKFTNNTTFSASVNGTTTSGVSQRIGFYLRCTVTSSTNVAFDFSSNGMVWNTGMSGQNPNLTVANVGLALITAGGAVTCNAYFDWIRFT